MLADHEIDALIDAGAIKYSPYDPALINPASIDMRLHHKIRVPMLEFGAEIDCRQVRPDHTYPYEIPDKGYCMAPGEFLLASTVERVELPSYIISRVEGKSSIGRLGLAVHITAGFIDPGFQGQVTLEIANLSPWGIRLYAGMRIAQMAFTPMRSGARVPYASTGHYQGQDGPTESRYKLDA